MSNEAEIAGLLTRVAALESLVVELLEAVGRIDADEAEGFTAPTSGYRLKPKGAKIALPPGPTRRRRQKLIDAAFGALPSD